MEVFRSIADLKAISGPVHLAIGAFDGVHRGHQEVIGSAMLAAKEEGNRAVVVTFDPHPIRVLAPERAPRMLTSPRHQRVLLERLGVEALLVLTFDDAFAALSGEAFVSALVSGPVDLAGIHVGERWQFGSARSGDVELLTQLGEREGFKVYPIKELVSSGAHREQYGCQRGALSGRP